VYCGFVGQLSRKEEDEEEDDDETRLRLVEEDVYRVWSVVGSRISCKVEVDDSLRPLENVMSLME